LDGAGNLDTALTAGTFFDENGANRPFLAARAESADAFNARDRSPLVAL